jgi:glycosyltransferase involved in cell wall biosynthesis
MMRVAYVCADPGVPVFGTKGCSVHVQAILRELRRQGIDVHLFAVRKGGEPTSEFQDLPCTFLELPQGLDADAREQRAWELNRHLALALAAAPNFDWVYERYSLWSYAGMQHAESAGIPGVLEVNAPLIEEQQRHRVLHDTHKASDVARRVMQMATTVVCVSSSLKPYVEGWGAKPSRVHVIPNGFAADAFASHAALRQRRNSPSRSTADKSAFTIGFVGSLKPWHGLEDLGHAFTQVHQRNPDVRLLIVGDGPSRTSFLETISPACRDNVEFTGAIPHSEVPGQLARMDVAVAPYPDHQPFYFSPLKIMEYMAAGLPVVASRVGDIPEWVTHGETGLLYAPGDIAGLTDSLLEMSQSPELCNSFGEQARIRVVQNGTWAHVVSQVLSLIKTSSSGLLTQSA